MNRQIFCETRGNRSLLVDLRLAEYAGWDVSIQEGENDSGELMLTIGCDNPSYHYLTTGITELIVEDDGIEFWRGRIAEQETAVLSGTKSIVAKGPLDYLHDTVFPPQKLSGTPEEALIVILDHHNSRPIGIQKRLYLGHCTVVGEVNLQISSPGNSWSALSQLLREHGGYLRTRRDGDKNYVDWLKKITDICTQPIVFGKNLLSLAATVAIDELFTAMCGFGKSTEGVYLTIADANDGDPFLSDSEAVAAFGWIEGQVSKSDIEDAASLKNAVAKRLAEALKEAKSVIATAVDLADLGNHEEHITYGCRVNVKSAAHGIDDEMTVNSIKRYLFEPWKTEITLGASYAAASKILARRII